MKKFDLSWFLMSPKQKTEGKLARQTKILRCAVSDLRLIAFFTAVKLNVEDNIHSFLESGSFNWATFDLSKEDQSSIRDYEIGVEESLKSLIKQHQKAVKKGIMVDFSVEDYIRQAIIDSDKEVQDFDFSGEFEPIIEYSGSRLDDCSYQSDKQMDL